MTEEVAYTGRDLEAMSFALNYHRWILRRFQPLLGKRVVEVGAGVGSFSELLVELPLESLALVEPSSKMYEVLEGKFGGGRQAIEVRTYHATLKRVASEISASLNPDSIIYVNVLEHIREDEAELRLAHQTLSQGGRLFIFVPALPSLFGPFDQKIGHCRRYTKARLIKTVERAAFRIIEARYFDIIGIIPWWLKYRLLKSDGMEPWAVNLYDRIAVPVVQRLEAFIEPPTGKNLLLIAEKLER